MLIQDFGYLLALFIKRRGLTFASFSVMVGRSKNYATGVVGGRHAPPLDELKAWAEALKLNAEEFEMFEEEALLAHCPAALVERYRRLKDAAQQRP